MFSTDFKTRLEIKSKLKEFYKFTHPDLFTNAPEEVQEGNSESIKILNEFLRNISTINIYVPKTSVTFYIKPEGRDEERANGKYSHFD